MSIASWTVTLAAAGLLFHTLNKKRATDSAAPIATDPQAAAQMANPDAYSTTDPVSGRVKPMPAMTADGEDLQPGT
jgi:hypothetical protein